MSIMDVTIDAGHVVEISTAPYTSPKKVASPLYGLERFPTQQEIDGQDPRNRRPVRPIDRQRMRPWLMELLDMGNVFGLRWTDRSQGIFQISWRHASRLGWNLETDGDVFERWARHTGIYKEGDPPEPKRWKANFRCALHSLQDVLELTHALDRRGRNACRTYQFLQSNSPASTKTKGKKIKIEPKEVKIPRNIIPILTYETNVPEPAETVEMVESNSSDEPVSDTESEGILRDKVIVQSLESKGQDLEEYLLHHDHDYSHGQAKTQKIVLRQGVGSIVLQKEIHSAPIERSEAKSQLLANLDQLASAAVDSETITIQSSPGPGALSETQAKVEHLGKTYPSKAILDFAFDDRREKTDYSLEDLLPRLRARIKESEKSLGSNRKRRGFEIDFRDLEIWDQNEKKKDNAETEAQSPPPPSPPNTRTRSGSPKKAGKVMPKSKKRKESEGSTSDSTEPLMSSCLLLLEAATRLDNAEKKGSSTSRQSSKVTKKAQAGNAPPPESKKKTPTKSVKKQRRLDASARTRGNKYVTQDTEPKEVPQDLIIEEAVYPEEAVEVIYDFKQEQPDSYNDDELENGIDVSQYHEILRTALENIGSELEITTESPEAGSPPRELSIMRRKKDSEKTPTQKLPIIGSFEDETLSSVAKGLFSGSDIFTDDQTESVIFKKKIKGKAKPALKEKVYVVDIHSDTGSLSLKEADDTDIDTIESPSTTTSVQNALGIQQTVIKRELPVLKRSAGKQTTSKLKGAASSTVIQTPKSGNKSPKVFKIATTQSATGQRHILVPVNSSEESEEYEVAMIDQTQEEQLSQVRSFITLDHNGKALLHKSDTSSGKTSSKIDANVKISTLPITASSAKHSVTDVQASTSVQEGYDQTIVKRVGQSHIATLSSDGKSWVLQEKETLDASSKPIMQMVAPRKRTKNAVATSSTPASKKSESLKSNLNLAAHVVVDPVKGPILRLPLSQLSAISQSTSEPDTENCSTVEEQLIEIKTEHECTENESTETESESREFLSEDSVAGVKQEVEDENGSSETLPTELIVTELAEEYVEGTEYHIMEGMGEGTSVIVQSEGGQQQFYITQGEDGQVEHIIQIPTSISADGVSEIVEVSSLDQINSIVNAGEEVVVDDSTHVLLSEDMSSGVDVKVENASEEGGDEEHNEKAGSDSMSMDPRNPLAIGEIPLFAASKEDSD